MRHARKCSLRDSFLQETSLCAMRMRRECLYWKLSDKKKKKPNELFRHLWAYLCDGDGDETQSKITKSKFSSLACAGEKIDQNFRITNNEQRIRKLKFAPEGCFSTVRVSSTILGAHNSYNSRRRLVSRCSGLPDWVDVRARAAFYHSEWSRSLLLTCFGSGETGAKHDALLHAICLLQLSRNIITKNRRKFIRRADLSN